MRWWGLTMTNLPFLQCEDGAVSVDFVALVAGLLIISVSIIAILENDMQSMIISLEYIFLTADDIERLKNG